MYVELTKVSGKGQVVIPQSIRESLKIKAGARFAVFGQDDTIVFKKVDLPTIADFKRLTEETSKIAKRKGIKKSDVEKAIREVRFKKK